MNTSARMRRLGRPRARAVLACGLFLLLALPAAALSTGSAPPSDWSAFGDQAEANFGYAVAAAGDANGDGIADILVTAYQYDGDQVDEGKAFVFYGSAGGPAAAPDWSAEGNQPGAAFGYAAAAAGDVNGDGYDDIIIGANEYSNGQSGEGAAFVFHGSATGFSLAPAWMAEGNQAGAGFGSAVAGAGDVNGDGFADVIVGAYSYDSGESNEGRAFLFLGSEFGLSPDPAWMAEGNQNMAWYGWSVGSAGDVNADGYADILVGAEFYEANQQRVGAVFVYHGAPAGPSLAPDWQATGSQSWEHLGFSAAGAGDVNGDGYSDIIIGGDGYSNGQREEGRAQVFHGSASGLSAAPAWSFEGDQTYAYLGWSVAGAGDVNGDGFGDVLVATPYYDDSAQNDGRIWVFYGAAGGLSASPAWTAGGGQADASLGDSAAGAGDVNHDGFDDVIVGAPYHDADLLKNAGAAYLFYGREAGRRQYLYLPLIERRG